MSLDEKLHLIQNIIICVLSSGWIGWTCFHGLKDWIAMKVHDALLDRDMERLHDRQWFMRTDAKTDIYDIVVKVGGPKTILIITNRFGHELACEFTQEQAADLVEGFVRGFKA